MCINSSLVAPSSDEGEERFGGWLSAPMVPNSQSCQALKTTGYGNPLSTPTKGFQPRVGLAWNIGGKSKDVLRAGFWDFRVEVYLAVSVLYRRGARIRK